MQKKQSKGIWADDTLGREEDGNFVAIFLRKRCEELAERGDNRSYVLNIDAQWGQGKTFFLERLKKQLIQDGHIAVYVNAWRDDFADDPLVAVMAAIDEEVSKHLPPKSAAMKAWNAVKASSGKIAWLMAKGLLKRSASMALTAGAVEAIQLTIAEGSSGQATVAAQELAAAASSEGATEIDNLLDGEADNAVSEFATTKASIETFRDNLSKFVAEVESTKGMAAPFFVLVDELDRCRPPYAIAMLERIKHLFETPNVAFVIATDSSQLVHSIGAVYGQGFEGQRYLKRFFDRTYVFEKPDPLRFVNHLLKTKPLNMDILSSPFENNHEMFISDFFYHSNYDLRSIDQMYDILRTVITTWLDSWPKVELIVLLPLIAYFHSDHAKFAKDKLNHEQLAPFFGSMKQSGMQFSGNTGRKANFKTRDTFVKVWQMSNADVLESYMRYSADENTQTHWIRQRATTEIETIFGNVSNISPSYKSIISEYPKMVRTAGRLTLINRIKKDAKEQN